ncbi:DUF4429 domain-containing protein [Streptosporangium sp. CA-115845]|uniref:DUF4429 domain-containing protein n=1 Tax=Streptosporangium sp. CA-115845 TaxID=3240071 RepID=UPI003D8A5263
MRADGYLGGWVEFDGQFVTIGHSGVSRMVAGGGTKRVHVTDIGAIQLKPAGLLTNGFIQFAISGSPELRSRVGHRTMEAGRDENSVIFTRKHQPHFEALAHAIDQAKAAIRMPPPSPQQSDVASQLATMWRLVEQRAMTRDEFEAQKARLLGTPAPRPNQQRPRG